MKIVSIMPDLGPGGLTAAVLSRTSLMVEGGEDASVVLYQYMPHFKEEIQKRINSGRLNSKVKIFNPYQYYDVLYSDMHGYSAEGYVGAFQHLSYTKEQIHESYFDEELSLQARVVRSISSRKLISIQYFEKSSVIRKEEIYFGKETPRIVRYFSNGSLTNERYLSANGFCYLRQDVNSETGKFTGFWSWGSKREVKFYKSIWDWRRDFVKNVVCADSTSNVLLCDGNNVPPQFLRLKSARFKVLPVIHMNHRDEHHRERKHYGSYFNKLNEFSAIICLTNEQADDLRDSYDVKTPIFVIPNRVSSLPAHKTNGLGRKFDVSIISRLEEGKGLIDAIEAFRLVVDELPRARLEIFGSGSMEQQITQLIKDRRLEKNVSLHGATLTPLTEMASTKVYIFTSESEGFGLTIAEALSTGTPVVSFDIKYGPSSLIEDGVTGYLVSGRNLQVLADRVVSLLVNEHQRAAFSQAAYRWFETNLSDKALLARWMNTVELVSKDL